MSLMISAHPLDLVEVPSGLTTSDLLSKLHGRFVRMAGILVASKPVTTKRGDRMRFLTLEDRHGLFEVTLFPAAWRRFGASIGDVGGMMVEGRVEGDWGMPSINASKLIVLEAVKAT